MNRTHLAALSALALAITALAIRRYHWRRPAARCDHPDVIHVGQACEYAAAWRAVEDAQR